MTVQGSRAGHAPREATTRRCPRRRVIDNVADPGFVLVGVWRGSHLFGVCAAASPGHPAWRDIPAQVVLSTSAVLALTVACFRQWQFRTKAMPQAVTFPGGCDARPWCPKPACMADETSDPRLDADAAAFVYGYTLKPSCVRVIGKLPAGTGTIVPGVTAFNSFGSARALLGPEAEFVSPNNDTLYVIAPCDASRGPLVLQVPDTGGRYYVLQFVDAWRNNFAYVGRRATGTGEGRFLLVGPDWIGRMPRRPAGRRGPDGRVHHRRPGPSRRRAPTWRRGARLCRPSSR